MAKIKMNTRHSLLLSACSILVFSRIAFAADLLTCKLPRILMVQISNDQSAYLYESELTVRMEKDDLTLTSYTGMNSVNIQANNVVVSFDGMMYFEYEDSNQTIVTQPEIISERYTDRISGVTLQNVLDFSDIDGCRIVLLPTETDRPGMTGRIPNEIRRLAESCIELELCQRINTMTPRFMTTLPAGSTPSLLSVRPDSNVIVAESCKTNCITDTVQPILNKVVDVSLIKLAEKLGTMDGGAYPVPDIEKKFSTGTGIVQTNGNFKAVNGSFRDFRTIRRISNLTLSHDGMKLMAACEFGLHIGHLNYPRYDLKYGIIKVNGKMSGSVNNTSIAIRLALDYNRKPCSLSMDHVKVTQLGKMKFELTGLGPLTWLTSKLVNWITNTWQQKTILTIEKELQGSINDQLSSFDCEIYRP